MKEITPEEVASRILRERRMIATRFVKTNVNEFVTHKKALNKKKANRDAIEDKLIDLALKGEYK